MYVILKDNINIVSPVGVACAIGGSTSCHVMRFRPIAVVHFSAVPVLQYSR